MEVLLTTKLKVTVLSGSMSIFLVPDNPGSREQLMSVEILDSSGKTIALLDAKNSTWTPYFEEFGGDNYLKGPEFNQTAPAGTYYVKVFNDNNQGKYSLAIGDIETFPPDETIKTLILLPILKADIFQVPVAELFIQFLGLILAMGTFLVLYVLLIRSQKIKCFAGDNKNSLQCHKSNNVNWGGHYCHNVVLDLL